MITPEFLSRWAPGCSRPVETAAKLNSAMSRFGICGPRRAAMFLAQLIHESALEPQTENLNYSAARLCAVWPSRFPSLVLAQQCAGNPEKLASRVYADRMGNGDEASRDGYRYRGCGFVQLTGKANYARYGQKTGFDLLGSPDLALQIGVGAQIAAAYFSDHGCNEHADRGDVEAVTRAINGGHVGLANRTRLYHELLTALSAPERTPA